MRTWNLVRKSIYKVILLIKEDYISWIISLINSRSWMLIRGVCGADSWRLTLPLARSSSSVALLAAGVLTFAVDPCGQYRKIRSALCVCVCIRIPTGREGEGVCECVSLQTTRVQHHLQAMLGATWSEPWVALLLRQTHCTQMCCFFFLAWGSSDLKTRSKWTSLPELKHNSEQIFTEGELRFNRVCVLPRLLQHSRKKM